MNSMNGGFNSANCVRTTCLINFETVAVHYSKKVGEVVFRVKWKLSACVEFIGEKRSRIV